MGWLIALGALAMLIGSISYVRPSGTQRRQARLRQEAVTAGMRVRLQNLHLPGETEPRELAVYTLARPPGAGERSAATPARWLAVRARNGGLDAISDEWQFLESDPAARRLAPHIAALAAQAGEEILALASSAGAVGVYWTEAAEKTDVAAVHRLLEELLRLPPAS